MPKLTVLTLAGEAIGLVVIAGASIMEAVTARGIPGIIGECGGNAMCATCHVYVDATWLARLPPVAPDEDALLDGTAEDRRPESRLGCQIRLGPDLDGLTVRLPARQV
jgi:2Fe-2S ferredoxin